MASANMFVGIMLTRNKVTWLLGIGTLLCLLASLLVAVQNTCRARRTRVKVTDTVLVEPGRG
ncbi:MAG: hypothetical protein KA354_08445 [Phycisphaerae bacterium]|nr:hypothetical protein [Phycisphaerae bacterium]